jgi:hypothetical protein
MFLASSFEELVGFGECPHVGHPLPDVLFKAAAPVAVLAVAE